MESSFRDPAGCLSFAGGRVIRQVNEAGRPALETFLATPMAQQFTSARQLVWTRPVTEETAPVALPAPASLMVEHERIEFQSFPYEWPPEMLHAAAALTLDLAEAALGEGFGLKDATPYNVLFRGPEPVFVDLLSFEQRDAHDPTWLPEAQFARTFLLPLLACKYLNLRLDGLLLTRRDGLEPEEVYGWCGPLRKWRPSFLSLVSTPVWLSGRADAEPAQVYRPRRLTQPGQSGFILRHLFKRLRRQLRRVQPNGHKKSHWSGYLANNQNAAPDYLREKQDFLTAACQEAAPRRVLDIGCNTGHFSLLAARNGASVVALDQDPVVVGEVWRQARAEKLNVLPLVVDITRPSPAMGWRNGENPSFLERARGAFDLVLMLAVVHHLIVNERVPLPEIIDLAAELTNDWLVIEFVAPQDPMFQRLVRGRGHLFTDLTNEAFRRACAERFEVVRCQQLADAQRWLYLLRKK